MKFDRDAAIDAAMRQLWRNGYEATSVQAMSAALGITRSSYYNTFGSREQLFALALERYLNVIPERALFTEDAERNFPEMLTALMRDVCHLRAGEYRGLGCLAANSIAELLPSESDAGKVIEQATQAMIARLTFLVSSAVERGELPKETDAPSKAMALHGMIMGLNLQSKVIPDEERLWGAVKETLAGLGMYKPSEET